MGRAFIHNSDRVLCSRFHDCLAAFLYLYQSQPPPPLFFLPLAAFFANLRSDLPIPLDIAFIAFFFSAPYCARSVLVMSSLKSLIVLRAYNRVSCTHEFTSPNPPHPHTSRSIDTAASAVKKDDTTLT